MGALFIFSLFLLIFSGLPLLTYLYAKHLGRDPKKWLLIGIFLPGLATLILALLPEKKQKSQDEL